MLKQKMIDRLHYTLVGNILEGYRIAKAYRRWLSRGGQTTIPFFLKPSVIKTFAQKYAIRVFVETGTYLGDMVAAVSSDFDKIYSTELSEDLFNRAANRFAGNDHITILHGDSVQVMPEILNHINIPCLFWLNGHYSSGNTAKEKKEASILGELGLICMNPIKNHVVLIDDAHLFTGKNDIPSLDCLKTFIKNRFSDYEFDILNNIIRIYKTL